MSKELQIKQNITIVYNDLVNHEQWLRSTLTDAYDNYQFEAMAKTLRDALDLLDTCDITEKPNTIFEDLECFGLRPELPQTRKALSFWKYPDNITNKGLVTFLKEIHGRLETRHIDHSRIPVMPLVDREALLEEQLTLVKQQIWFMASFIERKCNNVKPLHGSV